MARLKLKKLNRSRIDKPAAKLSVTLNQQELQKKGLTSLRDIYEHFNQPVDN
jgi:hypothetical protein